jgi:hypothetical protein
MEKFVNRDVEMGLIDDAFKNLGNYNDQYLRTPIIDFYGVEGIGKTAILKRVEQRCHDQHLHCISVDARRSLQQFPLDIIDQVRQYSVTIDWQQEDNLFQQSVNATRALLEQGSTVMLLDSVDATDEEFVKRIEIMLSDLIEGNRLFVVLTSKRSLLFDTERSVAHRFTPYKLKPFDRQSSEVYLDSIDPQFEPGVRNLIFDWTRGYPLAMYVMAQAITEQRLDLGKPEDQKALVAIIVERVINQGVLAEVRPEEFAEYEPALRLLSVPRRFNLVIMKELIEKFEPKLKQESIIRYMSLPRSINQATDVLSWNMLKAGFCVDDPVRNIFMLKSRIENSRHYYAIHRFLAQRNRQLATEVPGSDRIRYLREYLYHSAHVQDRQPLPHILKQTVQQIIGERPEFFQQFYEEFLQDEELKEAIGEEQTLLVLSQMHQYLEREKDK